MTYNPSLRHIITHDLRNLAECKTSDNEKSVFRSINIAVKTIDSNGVEVKYESMTQLARALGINVGKVKNIADKKGSYGELIIHYIGDNPYRIKETEKIKGRKKALTKDDKGNKKIYQSISSCARSLGVAKEAVLRAIENKQKINGLDIFLYAGDLVLNTGEHRCKKCIVTYPDGKTVICDSVKDAATLLGVKYSIVTNAMHRGYKAKGAVVKLLKGE